MDELNKLLYLAGVGADYLDYSGQLQRTELRDRLRALRVTGQYLDDPQALAQKVFQLDAAPWQRLLQPFYTCTTADPQISFHCAPEHFASELRWQIHSPCGATLAGRVRPSDCEESGEYTIGAVRYSARRLCLPALDPGLHRISLAGPAGEDSASLLVSPPRCHTLPGSDTRLWGISCQLYSLRSAHNWGIGDFADLRELIELAAACGADLIGLNPLHAPCAASPDPASPYSPSDRRFINPLYLHIEAMAAGAQARQLLAEPQLQAELQDLRDAALVDYAAVTRLKYRLFEALYEDFLQLPESPGLSAFCAAGGDSLRAFADYEVGNNPFARQRRADRQFHCWLQWQASTQLQECQALARELGMQVGLVSDLAVGAMPDGCEVQSNPQIFHTGANIGAPPDPLAPAGQNWGLPVPDPLGMRADGYHHFSELLDSAMAVSGALRIDHVMSLLRLWWCLPEDANGPSSGLYVYYPLQDLMALVRLESWRRRCLVIGEDLGVVPAEIRQEMAQSGLYGTTLLYFERWYDGRFKAPAEQRADALLMISNHDVPTLADWWNGSDLQRRHALGLLDDQAQLQQALDERAAARRQLLEWLDASGCLPDNRSPAESGAGMDYPLCEAIHRACAGGAARMLLVQLEDLQLMDSPVNIPGTFREYPNWRRKQAATTREIFARSEVRQLLGEVDRGRRHDRC
jgi:4-alpha-glucanotransferase